MFERYEILFDNASVIRQKGETQNGDNKKAKHGNTTEIDFSYIKHHVNVFFRSKIC